MKNSWSFDERINVQYADIIKYDKYGIDHPDSWNNNRISYQDRIKKIIDIVLKKLPDCSSTMVGEFGCAQGDVSLILAELGYEVVAIDICSDFIEYSKLKYESGNIRWVNSNIECVEFNGKNLSDVAILGEVIEHCAYPEDIIAKVLAYVKPNGFLIVTTPNGSIFGNRLPTFKRVFKKDDRRKYIEKQFGPDGDDHLFLFTLDELSLIVPSNAELVDKGYLGGTPVMKYLQRFCKMLPIKFVEKSVRFLAFIPFFNKKMINNVYMVLVKHV